MSKVWIKSVFNFVRKTWLGRLRTRDTCCNMPLMFFYNSIEVSRLQQNFKDRNLVDPASSHMLVSKIKPCMSKYKHFILWNCEWLIKSVIVYLIVPYYLDNRGNSSANTCCKPRLFGRGVFIRYKTNLLSGSFLVNHDNYSNRFERDDGSIKFLPYHLSMVV